MSYGVLQPISSASWAARGYWPEPSADGHHRRVAVKVIDPRGNEVLRVHRLNGKKTH